MKKLFLFTTEACHLCEQAEAVILPELKRNSLRLEKLEISDSDELIERYGLRIPVIALEGSEREEELAWPFNVELFLAWLARQSS